MPWLYALYVRCSVNYGYLIAVFQDGSEHALAASGFRGSVSLSGWAS